MHFTEFFFEFIRKIRSVIYFASNKLLSKLVSNSTSIGSIKIVPNMDMKTENLANHPDVSK